MRFLEKCKKLGVVMELLIEIEELRQVMNRLALLYGIQHRKVIEISQKLDMLLNEYYKGCLRLPTI